MTKFLAALVATVGANAGGWYAVVTTIERLLGL